MEANRFLALHFEMTNKCNLRCKHCYNIKYLESGKKDLTTDEIKKVIDKSLEAGVKDIGFSGGEPFMRDDIFELIEYSKAFPIHILSNGILIDEKVVERLNQIDDLFLEIRISLDGFSKHECLRNYDYKKVLHNIELLLKNNYVITVNTMITDDNLDQLMEMYEYFKTIGVDRWRLDFIFNAGNAMKNGIKYDEESKLFSVLKELIDRYIKEEPEMELDINKVFRSRFLYDKAPITYSLDSKPCEYQGSLTVRPNGDVSFCPSMDKTYGNIFESSVEDIANSDEWKAFANIKVRDLPSKCTECSYMEYCGGGCRADAYYSTSDVLGVSDFTCELVKFSVDYVLPKLGIA